MMRSSAASGGHARSSATWKGDAALTRRVLAAVTCLVLSAGDPAPAQAPQSQVLVLYTARRDSQIVMIGDREVPTALQDGLPQGLDYYSEFIDQGRFAQPDYQSAFAAYLRSKYVDHRFDVVIPIGDRALQFVAARRDELFPSTPVVFFASAPPQPPLDNATGLTSDVKLTGTLEVAARLQPDLRRVFVVNGTPGDVYETHARAQFAPFASRYEFTYLVGLPTAKLEAALAALPAQSMIYYLVVGRDGADQKFHPLEYLDRVTAVANAPVYSWVDAVLGHGVVGGRLKDQTAEARAIAGLALRVLRGERADAIPIAGPDLAVTALDWRALQRWGLDATPLGGTAQVRFREPSVWERYGAYLVAALGVLVAQFALIAGLLVQRDRRRRAEQEVRRSEAALRVSFERVRALGGRLIDAQEEERARIARELHDDVSQQVALLEIDLTLMANASGPEAQELSDDAVNRVREVARTVHELSHRLHPTKLGLIGLGRAVDGLQREWSQAGRCVVVSHDELPTALPPAVTLCVYRVAQEAIQNAVGHGQATRIAVHVAVRDGDLELDVEDNGVGFDVEGRWGEGLGLISMEERVAAAGGRFQIRSAPGAGTTVTATVPLAGDPASATGAPTALHPLPPLGVARARSGADSA
jgi:signal transduction histidine kinase